MPKHDKQVKKSIKSIESGPVSAKPNGTILIKVLAKPGAKQNAITDISEDGIGVQINAPPVEGAANTELVKYLASVLGLRKNDLTLEKGSKSRDKIVSISSEDTNIETILEKFHKEKTGS